MGELDGKVAIITGAGSGMARASVQTFLEHGARGIVAVDISGAENDTAAELGDAVLPVHCDVTDADDVAAMVAQGMAAFGRIDALLNVAGIGSSRKLLLDETNEQFDRIMNVGLRGVVLTTQHAVREMLKTGGGSVVNWASGAGINPVPSSSFYAASKAAVISMTKSTAIEYGLGGIRANCICPGPIHSEGMGHGMAREAYRKGYEQIVPLGRVGRTEEVAEVAAFLCSDRAAFVSGAIIPVDGAQSAQLNRNPEAGQVAYRPDAG